MLISNELSRAHVSLCTHIAGQVCLSDRASATVARFVGIASQPWTVWSGRDFLNPSFHHSSHEIHLVCIRRMNARLFVVFRFDDVLSYGGQPSFCLYSCVRVVKFQRLRIRNSGRFDVPKHHARLSPPHANSSFHQSTIQAVISRTTQNYPLTVAGKQPHSYSRGRSTSIPCPLPTCLWTKD